MHSIIVKDSVKKVLLNCFIFVRRKTIQETGLTDTALDVLAKCLGRTTDEIKVNKNSTIF